MKLVKGVLIIGVAFFIILTLLSLLIPSNIFIAKTVNVQADSTKVFNEISDLKNWKNWHPVFINNNANVQYSENTKSVNSFLTWESNGKQNKLLITNIKYPSISFSLQRKGENDLLNVIDVAAIKEGGNLQIQWKSKTKLKWYPWEKFSGIFIEKLSGQGYEAALQSLKVFVEKN